MLKPSACLLLSAVLLTAACQSREGAANQAASASAASEPAASAAATAPVPFTAPKPDDLLAQFGWYRERVRHDLINATPTQADALYEQFRADITRLANTLNRREQAFLDDYANHWTYDEKTDTGHPDAELQQRSARLAAAGLEYWYIGEGMAEIRPLADYYRQLFGSRVSPDYADFLRIEAGQNQTLVFNNDAAVVISWERLGSYALDWENFLQKHGSSRLAPAARCHYARYAEAYLLGTDNTPVWDDETQALLPEVKAEWQRLRRQHPDSTVARLTQAAEGMSADEKRPAGLSAALQKPDEDTCDRVFGYEAGG